MMSRKLSTSSKWVRIAQFLNRKVIKTPYRKATLYFIIAIALFVTFYLIMTHLNRIYP
ncbi:hypothetical protein J7M23_08815 [Candidatus Sumerlaeota bacterium]|nr:hypothetical protein [Candidatus Sumerlaeota bacterium]